MSFTWNAFAAHIGYTGLSMETSIPRTADTGEQVKSILLLALGWGCAVGANFIAVSSGTAVASIIKGDKHATLPIGVFSVFATLSALSTQLLTRLYHRRRVLSCASFLGMVGAALLCIAVHIQSFPLMVLACAPQGIAYGTSNMYRFIAVDLTTPNNRERALAAVVGGAVLAAVIGPEASRHIRFRMETDYLAAFILALGLWFLQLLCILYVDYTIPDRLPRPESAALPPSKDVEAGSKLRLPTEQLVHDAPSATAWGESSPDSPVSGPYSGKIPSAIVTHGENLPARPWTEYVFQLKFLLSALISADSFFVMAGLMAATPLAMDAVGHSVDDSTLVIEAHIVGMYLPSLFSGTLVKHLSPEVMGVFGTIVLIGGVLLFFVSTARWVFALALVLCGVGWNFNYVSASSLTVTLLQPSERMIGQGVFDALSLTGLSLSMMSSSFTYDALGWEMMYQVYLGLSAPIFTAAIVLLGCKIQMLNSKDWVAFSDTK